MAEGRNPNVGQPSPLTPNSQGQERNSGRTVMGQETFGGESGQVPDHPTNSQSQRTPMRPSAQGQGTTYRHPSRPSDGQ
jgi:hypothetical protein